MNLKRTLVVVVSCLASLTSLNPAAIAAVGECPCQHLRVSDTPSDGGGSVTLRWDGTGSGRTLIERAAAPDGP
ncbi:MAG TPA: hypothetical protein VMU02_02220, partial [bacterium]|nr:hypothetical protein [bacterium]